MGVFVNKFGIKKYLTGGKIAEILRSVAKRVHPDWSANELSRILSHSGRVWALVLLDEAGMSPAFMTSQLRWMGDSYKLYLRDTSILQHKHIDALKKESDELMKLLGTNKNVLPNIIPIDNDMEDYKILPLNLSFFYFLFLFFFFFFACSRHIMAFVITTRLSCYVLLL